MKKQITTKNGKGLKESPTTGGIKGKDGTGTAKTVADKIKESGNKKKLSDMQNQLSGGSRSKGG